MSVRHWAAAGAAVAVVGFAWSDAAQGGCGSGGGSGSGGKGMTRGPGGRSGPPPSMSPGGGGSSRMATQQAYYYQRMLAQWQASQLAARQQAAAQGQLVARQQAAAQQGQLVARQQAAGLGQLAAQRAAVAPAQPAKQAANPLAELIIAAAQPAKQPEPVILQPVAPKWPSPAPPAADPVAVDPFRKRVTVGPNGEAALMAFSRQGLRVYVDCERRGDYKSLRGMEEGRAVVLLRTPTAASIDTDSDDGIVHVRMEEGEHAGKVLAVYRKYVSTDAVARR